MAHAAAGIGVGLPFLGNELPIVAVSAKGELENSESGGIAGFAIWFWRAKGTKAFSASSNNKFSNPANCIGSAVRSLRSEALVVMIVAVDDYVGFGSVESVPKRFHR